MVVYTVLLIAISGAGTVVSTVKYISSSYDDGPYCPVYNLIVGMVVQPVLYIAFSVVGMVVHNVLFIALSVMGMVVHNVLFIAISGEETLVSTVLYIIISVMGNGVHTALYIHSLVHTVLCLSFSIV